MTYFKTQEFVSKEIYAKWGENSLWFIDPRLIKLADFIREFFDKPVKINDGGQYNYSGFREPECTVGAKLSQHRFGRAIDIKVTGMAPRAVFDAIRANESKFMEAGLTTLERAEDTPSWTHCDIRHTGLGHILVVPAT